MIVIEGVFVTSATGRMLREAVDTPRRNQGWTVPFPKDEEELKAAGYKFTGRGVCRGCHAFILWFRTPKDRPIPLDAKTLLPHWATCPRADEFLGKKK